jgi:hypothetical protein
MGPSQIQKGKYMTQLWKSALVTLFLAGAAWFAPVAKADEWDKQTVLTFNEPIELPGKILPAGTYVFRLADSQSDRNVVQVFTEDQKQLLATIMAIPAYRLEPTDKTVVTFDERPSGSPEALHKWFYPGDTYGFEFVYPKTDTQLAVKSEQPAPPAQAPAQLELPPAPQQEATAEQPETEPAASETVSEERVEEEIVIAQVETDEEPESTVQDTLPQTAGNFAMFPILSVMLLSAGFAAFRFANRHS